MCEILDRLIVPAFFTVLGTLLGLCSSWFLTKWVRRLTFQDQFLIPISKLRDELIVMPDQIDRNLVMWYQESIRQLESNMAHLRRSLPSVYRKADPIWQSYRGLAGQQPTTKSFIEFDVTRNRMLVGLTDLFEAIRRG